MIQIENARKEDAAIIAPMIMEAMNLECCQWFAGPNHTLEEFEQLMTRLVAMEESQYSYRNTLVAIDHGAEAGRTVAGVCVSYDGALLRPLRRAFIQEALETFGIGGERPGDGTAHRTARGRRQPQGRKALSAPRLRGGGRRLLGRPQDAQDAQAVNRTEEKPQPPRWKIAACLLAYVRLNLISLYRRWP